MYHLDQDAIEVLQGQIELDENYFQIAEDRIHRAIQNKESQTN